MDREVTTGVLLRLARRLPLVGCILLAYYGLDYLSKKQSEVSTGVEITEANRGDLKEALEKNEEVIRGRGGLP